MLKIFKWYIANDIDIQSIKNDFNWNIDQRNKYLEDKNWEQYLLIEKLKEENKRLNNLLNKKLIEEIGEPKVNKKR